MSWQTVSGPTFVPWDIEVARVNFGANCGPAAFAALVGTEVCRVMRYFPHFEYVRWTNLTQMLRAVECADYDAEVTRRAFPSRGLALIQWLGPWTDEIFFRDGVCAIRTGSRLRGLGCSIIRRKSGRDCGAGREALRKNSWARSHGRPDGP